MLRSPRTVVRVKRFPNSIEIPEAFKIRLRQPARRGLLHLWTSPNCVTNFLPVHIQARISFNRRNCIQMARGGRKSVLLRVRELNRPGDVSQTS